MVKKIQHRKNWTKILMLVLLNYNQQMTLIKTVSQPNEMFSKTTKNDFKN